jgi:hypothetical protein
MLKTFFSHMQNMIKFCNDTLKTMLGNEHIYLHNGIIVSEKIKEL